MAFPGTNISYQGQTISPNNPNAIRLQSGGIYNLPYGNFIVKPGAQSAIQWNDDYSGLWHAYDSGPVNAPAYIYSDGSNYRLINLSGTIQGATITAAGSAYTQANTTATFAAPSTGNTATATPIIGGSLTFTVTTAGSGYTNPILVIDPPQICGGTPGLCIQATAVANLSTGTISTITVSFAGAGYLTVPNVTILDPTGSGAVITAAIANGTPTSGGVTGIIMNSNGSGYDGTHIPAITITSATGSSATATALPWLALTSVTVAGTNTGYTATVVGKTSLGASASAPLAIFGDPVLVRQGSFTVAQSGGVLGAAVIEDAGGGFQTVPLAKQMGNATADGSVNATFTAVVGGVANTGLIWQIG